MSTEAMSTEETTFKRRIFVHLSWMTIAALALMAAHYAHAGARLPALVDCFFAAGLLLNLVLFTRHHHLRAAIRIGLGLGASNIISLTVVELGMQNGIHLWFFTLPLVSIYLLGKKEGAFWTIFYFLILFMVSIDQQAISNTHRIRFLLAYLVVAGFSYSYEHLRAETASCLEATNARLGRISHALSRYLSPQIRDGIISGASTTDITAGRKYLTFFFSDIVNFTATTDHLEPETLTSLLNSYLDEMSQIILKHGGTIDKYIGDAIVAFFGDPHSRGRKEDALACVQMALEMRDQMGKLREQWRDEGITETFHVRIGINSGFATVGNFGADQHMNYTTIGTQVNLAARLESAAETDQILVSESTCQLVQKEISCKKLGEFAMKGLSVPVAAYQVIDARERIEAENYSILHQEEGFSLQVEPAKIGKEARARAINLLQKTITLLE